MIVQLYIVQGLFEKNDYLDLFWRVGTILMLNLSKLTCPKKCCCCIYHFRQKKINLTAKRTVFICICLGQACPTLLFHKGHVLVGFYSFLFFS